MIKMLPRMHRLKRDHSIEYARSTQRNFVSWYLSGSCGGDRGCCPVRQKGMNRKNVNNFIVGKEMTKFGAKQAGGIPIAPSSNMGRKGMSMRPASSNFGSGSGVCRAD